MTPAEEKECVGHGIHYVTNHLLHQKQQSTQARLALDRISEGYAFGKFVGEKETRVVMRKLVRKKFKSWKCLKAMDCSSTGSLNTSFCGTYRCVEGMGKYEHGMLWSAASINQDCQCLEKKEKEIFPFRHVSTSSLQVKIILISKNN